GRPSAAKLVAAGLVIAALATVAVLGLTRVRINTTASAFLPPNDPAITSLVPLARAFGGDPIVILAESATPHELLTGDQLGRLVGLEGKLSRLPDVAVVYGPGTLLNQLAETAHDLMATIFGGQDAAKSAAETAAKTAGKSPAEVTQAGDAAVAQFNQRYGPLILQALPAGLPTLRNQQFVDTVAFDAAGDPRPAWRYLIPRPNAVAILVRPREHLDQAGMDRLVAATRDTVARSGLPARRITVSGTPTVFAELGERVQREIPLLGAAALALIIGAYLLIPWTERRRHRLVPIACTLCATVAVLAAFGWLGVRLSLGAIAFLPILIGVGSDFPAYVIHGVTRRRVLVTSGASAAGFAALSLSPLPFVRDLGVALACGVLLTVLIALGVRRFLRLGSGAAPSTPPAGAAARPTVVPSRRSRISALAVMLVIAGLGWLWLPRMSVQAQPEQLAAGLPSVSAAQHVEGVMGSSGEVDVMLTGPNVRTPAALAWLRQAEDNIVLRYGGALPVALSWPDLVNFLGPNPSQEQLNAATALLPRYLTAAVINDEGTSSIVSLGISLQDLRDQDTLLNDLRGALPPPPAGMRAQVVGLPAAAARGYELVSEHRYLANLAGILAAGLVLLIGLPRRTDAGRAVLAAVLATGWGLAGAALLHVPLSPLSIALGSLTTATACEFTVMLGQSGTHGRTALRRTVAVAALAAMLGYLALTLSGLALLAQFGLLLAGTVALSLLAAVLVTRLLPPRPDSRPGAAARNPSTTANEVVV
ncbi:MAG TPA: RND transporter, partial [Pseudonocardia sp.]